jgi:gas vesicle protein
MKKLSLLIGALGGAMAGYLFSNKQLRKDLATAKDAETAARLLGKHLQRDGKQLAEQARDFIESEDVQRNWRKAKEYTHETFQTARRELMKLVHRAEDAAGDAASDAGVAAKRAARRAVKTAKRAVRRAQMKVRKLL